MTSKTTEFNVHCYAQVHYGDGFCINYLIIYIVISSDATTTVNNYTWLNNVSKKANSIK